LLERAGRRAGRAKVGKNPARVAEDSTHGCRASADVCLSGRSTGMRRHHEELASIVPALALLVPLVGALWVRLTTGRKKGGD
jgi:hypothetical protein